MWTGIFSSLKIYGYSLYFCGPWNVIPMGAVCVMSVINMDKFYVWCFYFHPLRLTFTLMPRNFTICHDDKSLLSTSKDFDKYISWQRPTHFRPRSGCWHLWNVRDAINATKGNWNGLSVRHWSNYRNISCTMELMAKDDWYSSCSTVTRDVRLPVSAPGSPLLPGCRTSNCGLNRFQSNTMGRTEGRRGSAAPPLGHLKTGDGIRY